MEAAGELLALLLLEMELARSITGSSCSLRYRVGGKDAALECMV
jgi:hypothetical protein